MSSTISACLITAGRIVLLEANTAKILYFFTPPEDLACRILDAIFLPEFNQLCLLTDRATIRHLSLVKENVQKNDFESVELGPITLSNLAPLQQLELERLKYISYPPPDIKQHITQEKDGTYLTWGIPPGVSFAYFWY